MEKYRVTLFIIIVIVTWLLYYMFFIPRIRPDYQTQKGYEQRAIVNEKGPQRIKITPEIFKTTIPLSSQYLNLNFVIGKKTVKFENKLLKFKDREKNDYRLIHNGIFRFGVNNKLALIHSVRSENNKVIIDFKGGNKFNYSLSCKLSHDYLLDCEMMFENKRRSSIDIRFNTFFIAQMFGETNSINDIEIIYGYIFRDRDFKFKSFSSNNQFIFEKKDDKKLKWIGLANKYFIFTFIFPIEDAVFLAKYEKISQDNKSIKSNFKNVFVKFTLLPRSSLTLPFKMYIGPKQKEFLTKYKDLHLDNIYHFGFFDSISKFLFLILTFLYDIFKNYGVAIIFLTFIVRICLFPISVVHQRSIYKLQAVQPLIQKIQEKYKDNKEKLQKEFKKIYEKYKINPLMGCLPLFIQIPILFGLFNLFNYAIELRSAPFALWIDDLSQPDRAIHLKINFLGDDFLHILPILNILVWLLQIIVSKTSGLTTPTPGSSEQEKSMKFFMFLMPVIFGFVLYNAPSGLNLYWYLTTIFSIVEGFLIKRIVKKEQITIDE
ncbi:MAG: YidC/Oxa1 family insertase periplasmic-domain containing protein [Planctomycetota bacterium]